MTFSYFTTIIKIYTIMNRLFLLICVFSGLYSLPKYNAHAQTLSNELIWGTHQFTENEELSITDLGKDDSYAYHTLKRKGNGSLVVVRSYSTGVVLDTLFDSNSLPGNVPIEDFKINTSTGSLLIATNGKPVFRHSTMYKYYLITPGSSIPILLFEGKNVFSAEFSPNGKYVSYVEGNNIKLFEISTQKTKSVSVDGEDLKIINGIADWIYEEEFAFHKAYSWSNDSKYLCFYRFDESNIPLIKLDVRNDSTFTHPKNIRYPKAGEPNPDVTIKIYDLDNNTVSDCPVAGDNNSYIPRVMWTGESGMIAIVWMNRTQNTMKFIQYDVINKNTKDLYYEVDPRYIELPESIIFYNNGANFIFTSTLTQYNHIYVYSTKDEEKDQLTIGKWDVTKVYGIDELAGKAYFQAAIKDPMNYLVYSVDIKTGTIQEIGPASGYSEATFSNDLKYMVIKHSTISTPPSYSVYNAAGEKTYTIKDNIQIWNNLSELNLPKPYFFSFNTPDDIKLNGWMIKPSNFNALNQYPVLQFMYGGPGSQKVLNQWGDQRYLWHQMMAQKGFIIVCVDNRGTGARGVEFNKQVYKQLGITETHDQAQVTKYLGSLNYIDKKRIAVWGWSFGGYLTSMLATTHGELYAAAVAVAPVTDWRFYDSAYTERYMELPENNEDGYNNTAPLNNAANLSCPLLLIHGTADDNVHYSNSSKFAEAIKAAGKECTLMTVPDQAHSILDERTAVYNRITDFLIKKLKP